MKAKGKLVNQITLLIGYHHFPQALLKHLKRDVVFLHQVRRPHSFIFCDLTPQINDCPCHCCLLVPIKQRKFVQAKFRKISQQLLVLGWRILFLYENAQKLVNCWDLKLKTHYSQDKLLHLKQLTQIVKSVTSINESFCFWTDDLDQFWGHEEASDT